MVNLVHLKRNRRRYFHAGITTGRLPPCSQHRPHSSRAGISLLATNRTSQTLTSIVGQPLICSRRNAFFRKESARTHLPHRLPRRGLRPEPHARRVHSEFKNSMMASGSSPFGFSNCCLTWLGAPLTSRWRIAANKESRDGFFSPSLSFSTLWLLRNGCCGFIGIDAFVASCIHCPSHIVIS